MQALLLSWVSAGLVAFTPAFQDLPKNPDKDVVGYVADLSNPNQIVLTGGVGVPVNSKTAYWIQSGKRKPRKATLNDVIVGGQIRAVLGKDGVATKVTVIQER